MTKSTIVKWAVAVLLAAPVMPLYATTITPKARKTATAAHPVVRKLSASSKLHRPHHVVKRTTIATAARKSTHTLAAKPTIHNTKKAPIAHTAVTRTGRTTVASKGTGSKLTASRMSTSHSPARAAVKVTKTPPMIDGMHA